MAITIKSVTVGTDTGASATVSVTTSETPSATSVGDLVVVVYGNDYYTTAEMGTPTATGSPTLTAAVTADAGNLSAHLKSYTYVANTAGAQTISATETGLHDEEKQITAIVLGGADTTTPLDGTASNTDAVGSASQVAAAISPTQTNTLMIVVNNSGGGGSATSYTTPGSMTEQTEIHVGGLSGVVATEQLSASGSTGTRTFTASSGTQYGAVTIGIRTAAGGAVGTTAGPWTGPTPGRCGPTGQWRPGPLGDATTPLNVYVPGEAAGTGAAFDATVAVSPAADQTTGTGTAFDATPDIQVNAETTTGAGTAFDATVNVDYGNAAGPWTGPTPGYLGPTGRLTALLGDATTPLNVYVPAEATGTGTAFDATVDVGLAADQTTGTGTALDAALDVQVNAETTSATGVAFDATVSVDYGNYAAPWTGPTPGYLGPTGRLSALLGDATTAQDLVVSVPAEAAATGAAFGASVDVGIPADQATGTGTALDATGSVQVNADQTAGVGTAYDATVITTITEYAGPWTRPTPGRMGPTGRLSVLFGDATSVIPTAPGYLTSLASASSAIAAATAAATSTTTTATGASSTTTAGGG